MKRFALFLVWLFIYSLCSSAYAANAINIEKILTLISQDKPEQAYQEAQLLLADNEGDIDFDYAFGLAAHASKRFHHAIFAFERVIKNKPNWLTARYALAMSYFSAGNINAAEFELKQIQSLSKVEDFPNLAKYLRAIGEVRSSRGGQFKHHIELGLATDSNGNSGIDDDIVFIPVLGSINLFDSNQELDDNFIQAQWQTRYLKPLDLNTSWFALSNISYAHYQEYSHLSRTFVDVIAGWQTKTKSSHYLVNTFYQPLWLDDDKYLDYFGLNGEISRAIGKNNDWGASGTLAQISHELDDLDKNQFMLSLWYQQEYKQFNYRLTMSAGREDSDKNFEHLGRDFTGIDISVSGSVASRDLLKVQLSYMSSSYHEIHPLFLDERSDSMFKTKLNYQYYIDQNWAWFLSLSYLYNKSNLDLYEYDRSLFSTSFRYQF